MGRMGIEKWRSLAGVDMNSGGSRTYYTTYSIQGCSALENDELHNNNLNVDDHTQLWDKLSGKLTGLFSGDIWLSELLIVF